MTPLMAVLVTTVGSFRNAYWYLWAASPIWSFLNKVLPSSNNLLSNNNLEEINHEEEVFEVDDDKNVRTLYQVFPWP